MIKKITPTPWDKAADWWNSEAGDNGIWHQQYDIDPIVFEILGDVKNKKIIEIGCGNGYFARLLAGKGAKITAVDLSSKLLSFAEKKEKTNPLSIKYLLRDAADLREIKNESFDIAVANMSMMDIADTEKAIKEISRVLKENGCFIFSITHPVFCDYLQRWVMFEDGGKKYFAKATGIYLSSVIKKRILWTSQAEAPHYHHSVETWFGYLKNANFLVSDFREITTKKTVKKATEKDGDVEFRRSRYNTLAEKKIKEFAGKEIPYFLAIGAIKFKDKI